MIWSWMYCFKWDIEFHVLKIAHADAKACFNMDNWGAVFVCAQLASLFLSHIVMHAVGPSNQVVPQQVLINRGEEQTRTYIPNRALHKLLGHMFFAVAAAANLVILYYIMVILPVFEFSFEGEVPNVVGQLEHHLSLTMFEFVTKSSEYACGKKDLVIITCYFALLVCPLLATISLFWWRAFLLFAPYKQNTIKGWRRATELITVYNCLDVMILSLQFTNSHFPQLFNALMIGAFDQKITDMQKYIRADFPNTTGYKLLFVYAGVHWVTYFYSEYETKSKLRRYDIQELAGTA